MQCVCILYVCHVISIWWSKLIIREEEQLLGSITHWISLINKLNWGLLNNTQYKVSQWETRRVLKSIFILPDNIKEQKQMWTSVISQQKQPEKREREKSHRLRFNDPDPAKQKQKWSRRIVTKEKTIHEINKCINVCTSNSTCRWWMFFTFKWWYKTIRTNIENVWKSSQSPDHIGFFKAKNKFTLLTNNKNHLERKWRKLSQLISCVSPPSLRRK